MAKSYVKRNYTRKAPLPLCELSIHVAACLTDSLIYVTPPVRPNFCTPRPRP